MRSVMKQLMWQCPSRIFELEPLLYTRSLTKRGHADPRKNWRCAVQVKVVFLSIFEWNYANAVTQRTFWAVACHITGRQTVVTSATPSSTSLEFLYRRGRGTDTGLKSTYKRLASPTPRSVDFLWKMTNDVLSWTLNRTKSQYMGLLWISCMFWSWSLS